MFRHFFKKLPGRSHQYAFFNTNTSKSELPRVRVSSVDHDGCFGLPYMNPNEIDMGHAHVIESMNEQKKLSSYTHDYVMSFSNRQSIRRDCFNALYNKNNLAFPVAMILAKKLGAYFDPLLLADITAHKKPGFTISSMRNELAKRTINLFNSQPSDEVLHELMASHSLDFTFSEDKINIIYAQIHRMALMHPSATIHFDIYDDLIEEVLKPSSVFFKQYPSLLPINVSLNFYHYCSTRESLTLPEKLLTITGDGHVDSAYYETINTMAHIAYREEGAIATYHMTNYISPERIYDFSLSHTSENKFKPIF